MSAAGGGRRGLIIQPGALGDCILTVVLARLMIAQAGVGQVDLMGHQRYAAVLRGRSQVGRIIDLEMPGLHRLFGQGASLDLEDDDPLISFFGPYDYVVTFLQDEQGHFEENLVHITAMTHGAEVASLALRPPGSYEAHVSRFFMEQFIAQVPALDMVIPYQVSRGPLLRLREDDRRWARGYLGERGVDLGRPYVTVAPGSGGQQKCWPPEQFGQLLGLLGERGVQTVVLLGPVEMARWGRDGAECYYDKSLVVNDLTIEQAAAVVGLAAGSVGNDSGISHLAGGLQVASVVVFGPSESRHWRPLGDGVRVCRAQGADRGEWPGAEEVAGELIGLLGLPE